MSDVMLFKDEWRFISCKKNNVRNATTGPPIFTTLSWVTAAEKEISVTVNTYVSSSRS